jgi:hypothetical protein
LAAHGFFAAQGFFAEQGFFAAHGFFAEQGFLAAHGLVDFAAQGFFAAHGFDFWARAEPAVPRLRTPATTTAVAVVRTIRVTSFLLLLLRLTRRPPGLFLGRAPNPRGIDEPSRAV